MAFVNDSMTTDEFVSDNKNEHLDPESSCCDAVELEVPVSSAKSDIEPNENASCSFENAGYSSSEMYKKVPTKITDSPVRSRAQKDNVSPVGQDDEEFEQERRKKSKYNWKQFLPIAPR